MAEHSIVPSLADISQDVAGEIPVDVVVRWAMSDRSAATHEELIAPHVVQGTIVCSDSVGLSKLTTERSLCDVLELVDGPKQVLIEHAEPIGGRAVGTWVADNSETFFDSTVGVQDVVEQMICAQREIAQLPIQIGLGIHCGEFVSLSSGLFGQEVDVVETLAEDYTAGGEIAVTEAVKRRLAAPLQGRLMPKEFPYAPTYSLLYRDIAVEGPRHPHAAYPAPYPHDFLRYVRTRRSAGAQDELDRRYARKGLVVLVRVHYPRNAFLLDELAGLVLSNFILREVARQYPVERIKSNGSLGIYVGEDLEAVLEFSRELRSQMQSSDYGVSVAVASGEILVFPMDSNGKDIAGGPVNVASKWAEDSGVNGKIIVDSSVQDRRGACLGGDDMTLSISGVVLTATCLS